MYTALQKKTNIRVNLQKLIRNNETYASIDGYDDYLISDHGNVFSSKTGKLLKQQNKSGFMQVPLYHNDGSRKMFLIHRLVATEFLPNPENKTCINHIDGDNSNNHVNNLRWATEQDIQRNRKLTSKNTSGHKGVSFDHTQNRWKACITTNKATVHLGYFKKKEDAINARVQKAVELHGEFFNE
jgi:hypothetical protein